MALHVTLAGSDRVNACRRRCCCCCWVLTVAVAFVISWPHFPIHLIFNFYVLKEQTGFLQLDSSLLYACELKIEDFFKYLDNIQFSPGVI